MLDNRNGGPPKLKNLFLVAVLIATFSGRAIAGTCFTYTIGENFDVDGFLASMLASSIKLYATNYDSPNGYTFPWGGNKRDVCLYDDDVAPMNTLNLKRAGRAKLSGDLSSYKPTIDAAIAANNP